MDRDLKYNDVGEDVRLLQKALNEILGMRNKPDGQYGKLTEEAVRTYQARQGLDVNGVIGDVEKESLVPYIESRFLTIDAIVQAADGAGIPASMMLAIREVEAKSDGFLMDRRPIILFERHKMYLYTSRLVGTAFADNMVRLHGDIINPERGGYQGYEAEYNRLDKAQGINKQAALMSASWGMFQIMGFNHKACGYMSIDQFISDMYRSEKDHLNAAVRFITGNNNLLMAARQRNHLRFAENYNGAGQQGYDVKLRDADNKYKQLGF